MNDISELEQLIDQIMKTHNVYCTVSIKPSYGKSGNVYECPKYEVYISRMPSGMNFFKELTIQGAIDKLTMYLNGRPSDHFEKMKKERISELNSRISDAKEEIKKLRGEE